jgi:adenylate cyclase
LLVVDPRDGGQYRLDLAWREAVRAGPVFDRLAATLRASSAQLGMADVMRLRSADIYRVVAIRPVPGNPPPAARPAPPVTALERAVDVVEAFADAVDLDAAIDAVAAGLGSAFRAAVMVLVPAAAQDRLVVIGSHGYGRSGVGAEVGLGEGLIGIAAAERRCLRVSDMSRLRRLGTAGDASQEQENRTRAVSLAGLPDAVSQIAVPVLAQGRLHGALLLESSRRLAFAAEDELALRLVARQLGAWLAAFEADAAPGAPPSPMPEPAGPPPSQDTFCVEHHPHDDSVFIDGAYLVRGVPARLLLHMLAVHLRVGRREFSNRELRANRGLRLPDLKDNLETRLLLLRRRLEDKDAPVRLVRPVRGMVRIDLRARPIIRRVPER